MNTLVKKAKKDYKKSKQNPAQHEAERKTFIDKFLSFMSTKKYPRYHAVLKPL